MRVRPTYRTSRCFVVTLLLITAIGSAFHLYAADSDLAPLPLKLPLPTLKGTPDNLPKGANIEPPPEGPRAAFLAPKGAVNVALNKKVTASDKRLITGELSQITDGQKEAYDDQVVEMRRGVQWVQIDLGEVCEIYAVVVWHDHRVLQIFRNVVIQTADDPDFVENVTVLFNNDTENVAGLGIGFDRQFFETQHGKLIPAKSGLRARYLRLYSKGSNLSAFNCYQEVEVYGKPAK